MSQQTINAKRMEEAIAELNHIDFALIVGGFALSVDTDSFEHIVSKPWKWLDEIAEWVLDTDEELAKRFDLMPIETCQECFSMTDKFDGEIDHDSDCSKGA